MPLIRRLMVPLLLSLGLFAFAGAASAADNGLITVPSHYSVKQTIARYETAVKAKAKAGWAIFGTIDHAAAARKAGLSLRPRTVILFGNPKLGTPGMAKAPTLAIDLPMKALVWQDNAGKVWLTYNSAAYLGTVINARHGLPNPPTTPKLAALLRSFADQATK
ncbi:MAG: DUF302 domain-containing protein [Acetobacteraceae bacterium]